MLSAATSDPIGFNFSSCSCHRVDSSNTFVQFSAHVGRPYINGAGCTPIQDTLNDMIEGGVTKYSCVDDGCGYTEFGFVVQNTTANLDNVPSALHVAYPDMDDICRFNITNANKLMARTDPIEYDCASCSVRNVEDGSVAILDEYSVHVGRPFINGAGCTPIQDTLNSMFDRGVTQYSCKDDGYCNTQLVFVVQVALFAYQAINQAMQIAYPDVPFLANHICDIHLGVEPFSPAMGDEG